MGVRQKGNIMVNFGLGLASWILGLRGIEEYKAHGIVDIIRYFFK